VTLLLFDSLDSLLLCCDLLTRLSLVLSAQACLERVQTPETEEIKQHERQLGGFTFSSAFFPSLNSLTQVNTSGGAPNKFASFQTYMVGRDVLYRGQIFGVPLDELMPDDRIPESILVCVAQSLWWIYRP
jgi:hypothetical protein